MLTLLRNMLEGGGQCYGLCDARRAGWREDRLQVERAEREAGGFSRKSVAWEVHEGFVIAGRDRNRCLRLVVPIFDLKGDDSFV